MKYTGIKKKMKWYFSVSNMHDMFSILFEKKFFNFVYKWKFKTTWILPSDNMGNISQSLYSIKQNLQLN